jgi:prophage regulatory protein
MFRAVPGRFTFNRKRRNMAAQIREALTRITILRRKQVEARTGLSRSSIYAKLRHNPKRPGDYDPTFPKPIAVGAKAVGWIEAEIEAWLTAQIEKSRKA